MKKTKKSKRKKPNSGGNRGRNGKTSRGTASEQGSRKRTTSSSKSSFRGRGNEKPRVRPRFALPKDEFDKIYRARAESSLDPSLAISTTKNFEPDRGPIPPKKYGILFVESVAKAIELHKNKLPELEGVEELHISIAAEGNREIEELLPGAKVFAGNAWATVLQRRVEENWYAAVFSDLKA